MDSIKVSKPKYILILNVPLKEEFTEKCQCAVYLFTLSKQ